MNVKIKNVPVEIANDIWNAAIDEAANTLRNNTTGTWCDNYVYMIRRLKK